VDVLVEFSISSKVEESAGSIVGTGSESVSVREETVKTGFDDISFERIAM